MKNHYLVDLITKLEELQKEVSLEFGNLNSAQLNWKQDQSKWSVGQCFDHLIITNEFYFSVLKDVINGRKKRLWERIPFLPGMIGHIFIKAVAPIPQKKIQAPAIFQPLHSKIRETIINDFVEHQSRFIKLIQQTDLVDHQTLIVTSPALNLMVFPLKDCCTVLTNHEARHFFQAKQVVQSEDFPD